MQRKCAWCDKSLAPDHNANKPERLISHGICIDCARKMFETMSEPMQEFLDKFPGPVLVMDPEENVLAANHRAIEISAVAPDQIRGMKCGNVLKCQQAEKSEGCSRSDKCRRCVMLQAMRYSHSTGLPKVRIPASPEFEWLDGRRTVIYVSSEKIGDLVILTLEELVTED